MSQLRTNIEAGDTGEIADTNEVHRLHNQLDDAAASNGDVLKLVAGAWVADTPATLGISETDHTHEEADVTDLDHTDTAAIHAATAAEISAITAKGTPTDADFLLIEDAAASNAKKRITIGDLPVAAASPLTTKGDLHVYTTVDARLPLGTNDHVLTADSGEASGVKWAAATGGSGGLEVDELSSDTTLTASGVYIVDTTSGNITITLPILSGTPAAGYRIQILREGANYVYVEPNAADEFWDTTTQKTIFDDYGAHSVVAGASSTVWLELGRYRTVT